MDDIFITGNDQDDIQKLKTPLQYFLGIKLEQSNSDVVISQKKYTLDILADISMLDCKLVDTPMDLNVKLVPRQGKALQDRRRYQ